MSYRYISIKAFGGPEVLGLVTEKRPSEPNYREVRVKEQVTSINFTYTLIRRGIYPDVKDKPPITPSYDMVGIVDKLGDGVTDFLFEMPQNLGLNGIGMMVNVLIILFLTILTMENGITTEIQSNLCYGNMKTL